MHLLGRRNFLAGLGLGAGSHLLGAMFKGLLPEALGQPTLKKRFFLYFSTYNAGEGIPTPAADGSIALGPAFKALEPYKSELLVVDKLYNPFNRHLHGNFWSLSVAPGQNVTGKNINTGDGNARSPGDVSLDRHLAKTIGANDPWPSLALAPVPIEHSEIGGTVLGYSADGPGRHFPAIREPFRAYGTIFAKGVPTTGGDPAQFLAREKSLLDFVAEDVARMNARLAGPERAKMDQFTDAIRATEKRLAALAQSGGSCKKPTAPAMSLDTGIGPVVNAPINPDIIAAHVDMATTAVICGLTRVVNLTVGASMSYKFLGEDGRVGEHLMWHDQGTAQKYLKYTTYHMANLALIRQRLGAVAEGNGTIASNTLLMLHDESGGKHHLGYNDIRLLFMGSAGGKLKTGGRAVVFPKNERCVSDAYVSVLNALDVPAQTFGAPERCKGPLPGLAV